MEWELVSRSRKCINCEKQFDIGEEYASAVFFEDEKIKKLFPKKELNLKEIKSQQAFIQTAKRIELCPDCWQAKMKEQNPDGFWKTKYKKNTEIKKELNLSAKEMIFNTFKEYYGKANESNVDNDSFIEYNGISYFLAIMLERKSILKHQKDFIDPHTNAKTAIYFHPKSEKEFHIKYPLLSKDVMVLYNEKIAELLKS